jgi:ADP-heptose:LPS heptosyltransferase
MKILLVRCDGVGDALVCTPLIAALRDAGHQLGVVLGVGNRDIFARRTFANTHVLERISWPAHGSTPKSRAQALDEVKLVGYDIALIASEEIDAYQFAKDAKIPRRIGFINGGEKPLKTVRVRSLLTDAIVRTASAKNATEHEVRVMFKLGAGLHDEPGPTRDAARLRELVLDQRVRKTGYVMLQTSDKNERAGLDRETYIALAQSLQHSRCQVVLLGDEITVVNAVAKASGAMADGLLSTIEWKERIASARALITPDSGAAHVAGMIGLPTIDCFKGGPNSAADIKRWSPWAAPHRSLVLASAPPEFMAGALVGELYDLLASLKR